MPPRTIKVLLVTDKEEHYLLTYDLLQQSKKVCYVVERVSTYERAIASIQHHEHDVYLVDYQFGQHTGLDLLRAPIVQARKIPLILLADQEDQANETEAVRLGAADYLPKKEISAALLERAIRYAIEQTRTLAVLNESEFRLIELLSSLQDMVWSVSATTHEVLYVSPAAYGIYGRPASAFFENPNLWVEVVHPEDQARVAAAHKTLLSLGTKDLEYRIIHPDGSIRWIRDRACLVCDITQDAATRIDGIATDISDRKQAEAALEQLRHQNTLILNSAGEGIFSLDLQGKVTLVNLAAANMLNWEIEDLLGQQMHDIAHHSYPDGTYYCHKDCPIYASFQDGVIHHSDKEVFWRKEGSCFPVEYISTPLWENGRLIGAVVTFQDITDRKQSEAALRESEERYALALRGANDGIWDWNLKTNRVYFSSRWKSMLGYEEKAISNCLEEWFNRVHPDDLEWVKVELVNHLKGLTPHFENEHRVLHSDGNYRWMLIRGLAVRDEADRISRMAGSQSDITDRKRAEQQLLRDALYDPLTHLPNRTLFMDRLQCAMESCKQYDNYLFAVLFLDLDRFKVINDSLGHLVGDQLLIAIARRLETCLRTVDTVSRLSGDEFAILLENIKEPNDAILVAERIQQELAVSFSLEGYEVFANVSIGIALSTPEYDKPEDILRDADTAMYRAKTLGKSQYVLFNTDMHAHVMSLLQLEIDLRRAIERKEFELYYQPIIGIHRNQLAGFEALIRWRHPEKGLISPADFIPVAEETGLIVAIGHWVLREACQQMQAWQTQFCPKLPLVMSVNLSCRQFSQPDLTEQVEQVLQETGLNPKSLKLEITESTVMGNAESATNMLLQLKALGIQLSIDDFGTGYSSLSYLHRFPIDTLKIDRSFTMRIDVDGEQLEMVRTIVTLAWNLGMDVVAEGVETATQLAQLRALNCEYAQGYFFSKPLDSLAAEDFIAQVFNQVSN